MNQIIPGTVVFLKSSPDCKMTVGYAYGNGFYDCVWLGANKELQVRKLHATMLLTETNAMVSGQKTIGFKPTSVPEQREFYAKSNLTWL